MDSVDGVKCSALGLRFDELEAVAAGVLPVALSHCHQILDVGHFSVGNAGSVDRSEPVGLSHGWAACVGLLQCSTL